MSQDKDRWVYAIIESAVVEDFEYGPEDWTEFLEDAEISMAQYEQIRQWWLSSDADEYLDWMKKRLVADLVALGAEPGALESLEELWNIDARWLLVTLYEDGLLSVQTPSDARNVLDPLADRTGLGEDLAEIAEELVAWVATGGPNVMVDRLAEMTADLAARLEALDQS